MLTKANGCDILNKLSPRKSTGCRTCSACAKPARKWICSLMCCRTIVLCTRNILWKQASKNVLAQSPALLEPWQINSNATLKNSKSGSCESNSPQENFREQSLRDKTTQRNSKESKVHIPDERFKDKPDKLAGENNQDCFCNQRLLQTFNMRVWSWLRMNAGGVLNTCKSNGLLMKPSDLKVSGGRVSNAWVTCRIPGDNT